MKKAAVFLIFLNVIVTNGQNNLLDTSSWTVGSGSVTGFTQNGTTSENIRELDITPFGNQDVIWKGSPDGVTPNTNGGWSTTNIPIDHTKTYRYSVWIKKTNSFDGSEVFGVAMSDSGFQNALLRLDGSNGGNGIIVSGNVPQLNKWYLYVGFVYNSGHTGTTSHGGVYDPVTGNKVLNGLDHKSSPLAVSTKHKAYLWAGENPSDIIHFYGPTIYEVNGQEPTLQELLDGPNSSDTEPPTAPILTSIGSSQTTVDLSWTVATDNVGVTGYHVYRNGVIIANNISSTSYQDTGLSPSTTYNFSVRALDATGNVSIDSNIVSATTDNTSDTQAPTAPTLSSIGQTDTTVDLSWNNATDNVGITGYKIFRGSTLEITLSDVNTYQVTGLTSDTSYSFTVMALDAAGNESAGSNIVTVTTNSSSGSGNGQPIEYYEGKLSFGNSSVGWYKLATFDLAGNGSHNSIIVDANINYVRTSEAGYAASAKLFIREGATQGGRWSYSITGTQIGDYIKYKKVNDTTYELFGYSPGNYGHISIRLALTSEAALIVTVPTTKVLVPNPDVYLDVPKISKASIFVDNLGIGTFNTSSYKLAVNGKIRANEIKVETGWADYVFANEYSLPTLLEVEQHIKEKGHLINIPSAEEVEQNGIHLGEMNKLLLEKIEELTLYAIQQQKELQELQEVNRKLEERLQKLEEPLTITTTRKWKNKKNQTNTN
ncbi:hypothetical protein GTQ34_16020 [Muricauda sp. JGD-17]|uniref:Fibronectin type-III domain-containing protein n=1 Tax=Flagellimonas ochracea TaxID=2696472 RepID=A0A964TEE9_9FLAO|nr:fibronectin type III domain-containing protein [Allomuricauda ochracea]NAY93418.1 hypothetical protein [Allomuricauda ochracea]